MSDFHILGIPDRISGGMYVVAQFGWHIPFQNPSQDVGWGASESVDADLFVTKRGKCLGTPSTTPHIENLLTVLWAHT